MLSQRVKSVLIAKRLWVRGSEGKCIGHKWSHQAILGRLHCMYITHRRQPLDNQEIRVMYVEIKLEEHAWWRRINWSKGAWPSNIQCYRQCGGDFPSNSKVLRFLIWWVVEQRRLIISKVMHLWEKYPSRYLFTCLTAVLIRKVGSWIDPEAFVTKAYYKNIEPLFIQSSTTFGIRILSVYRH